MESDNAHLGKTVLPIIVMSDVVVLGNIFNRGERRLLNKYYG
jgi:hypothetical protein